MNNIRKEDIENIIATKLPWEKLAEKTILISGAAGFIASYIVDTLLALSNVKIIGIVRNINNAYIKFPYWKNATNLKLIEQDISKPFDISYKIDYIIHAASHASPKYYGVDPVGTLKANTLGTSYLLDIGVKNKIKGFIFFSSGEIYGPTNKNTPTLTESYWGQIDCTDLRSCYGESKRMGENMCICYSYQYEIPVKIIRICHTYGPGVSLDDGRCFGDFAKNIVCNENIVLKSKGDAKRYFLYIKDMILGMFYVLFFGKDKNSYNIASSKKISILDLAKMLICLFPEKKLNIIINENAITQGYIKSPSIDVNIDISKLKSLGWNESIDIKKGFKRMIESYNSN